MKRRLRAWRSQMFLFVIMAMLGAVKDWGLLATALNRVEDALLLMARYRQGYQLGRMVDQINARRAYARDHPIDWHRS